MPVNDAVNQTKVALFDAMPRSAFIEARRLFHKVDRPLLLGEVASEIGWSLERTLQVVGQLVKDGAVKRGTKSDAVGLGACENADVFVLAEPRQLALGHR